MKMTSGVGLSDLAFHRSMTLIFLSLLYTTLVMSGGVVEAGFLRQALGSRFFRIGVLFLRRQESRAQKCRDQPHAKHPKVFHSVSP